MIIILQLYQVSNCYKQSQILDYKNLLQMGTRNDLLLNAVSNMDTE